MPTMDSPATPEHPPPDGNIPDFPQDLDDDLDLNPELYDASDTEEPPSTGVSQLVDTFTTLTELAIDHAKLQFVTEPVVLSGGQVSQFIMDIDAQILAVQRRFIKSQAGELECSVFEMIDGFNPIIASIWTTVTQRNRLFGQQDYFIRILGLFEDILAHFRRPFGTVDVSRALPASVLTQMLKYFTFFQSLDVYLSIFIDGYEGPQQKRQQMSRTELVRLVPLVNRVRMVVAAQLGPFMEKLVFVEDETYASLRQVLDIELTRVFEGVLDRTNS